MKKIKDNLYEFDPVIYPVLLWISVGDCANDGVFIDLEEMPKNSYATVVKTAKKRTGRGGTLIRFESLDAIRCGIIAHESFHAASDIFSYIGASVNTEDQEPFAYLCGFIGKCIGIVREEVLKSGGKNIKETEVEVCK